LKNRPKGYLENLVSQKDKQAKKLVNYLNSPEKSRWIVG